MRGTYRQCCGRGLFFGEECQLCDGNGVWVFVTPKAPMKEPMTPEEVAAFEKLWPA